VAGVGGELLQPFPSLVSPYIDRITSYFAFDDDERVARTARPLP